MKLSLIMLFHGLMLLVGLTVASDHPSFTAVFAFKNMTAFYQYLRNMEMPSDMDASRLPEIKKRICQQITNSQFFRRDGFEHIDPENRSWYSKLKAIRNRDTFRELFKKQNFNPANMLADAFKTIVNGNYTYENEYVPKVVRFDEMDVLKLEVPLEDRPPTPGRKIKLDVSGLGQQPVSDIEHLFLCLTRKGNSTKDFQKWYVSKEYNTRARTYRPEPSIAGRFVFKLSELEKELEVVALATEAAVEFTPPLPLQLYYINTIRRGRSEAKNIDEDPLCKLILDADEHCRLCSAVMNSEYFLEGVEMPDVCENVKRRCSKMEVILSQDFAGSRRYFENMTPCKVQSKHTKNSTHYYISRAYRDDAVLVYQPTYQTLGKMGIVKMFTNVNISDNGRSLSSKHRSKGGMARSRSRSPSPSQANENTGMEVGS